MNVGFFSILEDFFYENSNGFLSIINHGQIYIEEDDCRTSSCRTDAW